MGVGHAVIYSGWKLVMLAAYAGLYLLSPLRLDPSDWWVWVLLFFADDLTYYAYHRAHHRIRLFWATHVVHHSSQHYNLSTALRQDWTPFSSIFFWAPLALLGFAPWMILLAISWNLLYQFWIHTEKIRKLPRLVRGGLQHAQPPPRPPRRQRAVPRQELRRDPDHLGPAVRHLRARGGARPLRPDDEHRDLQPGPRRLPRVRRDLARRARRDQLARRGSATCSGAPAGSRGRRRRHERRPPVR